MYPNSMYGIEGFIAREPEEVHTQSGKLLKKFTIFISEGRDDDRQSAPVDVVLWEKVAERFDGVKGDRVLVQGRPKPEEWTDKNTGKQRYKISLTGELAIVTWRKEQTEMVIPEKEEPAFKGTADEDDLPF